jgi:cytochrome P450
VTLVLGPVGAQGVPVMSGRLTDIADWADPYPTYRELRQAAPIAHQPELDELVVTRWADCERILRDPTFSSNPRHRRLPDDAAFAEAAVSLPVLLFMDPPDHTRLRGLVSRAFTPRTVERLRPHVAELVDGMLWEVAGGGPFDLIEQVAYPLPVTVICELLGVPVEDRHRFGPWSSDASRLLDGILEEATINAGIAAMLQLVAYFAELFAERRAHPRDDLVSALLAVEEEGDRLSEEELQAIVILLFVAGHETTMNLIGNGTVALLQHRGQWERLVVDPDLAPSAVEELLRFDGPVHVTARTATQDSVVGDVRVEQGQGVLVHLAAANRDPARFERPDELDLTRPDVQHLTFSHGIHYCLGAALARLEGQETFRALARRFPGLELAEEPVHRDHFVLRGYRAVQLALP